MINLSKYRGGKFPGPPLVRAWAESLTCIPTGELSQNLVKVFENFGDVPLNEPMLELISDIVEVCCKKENTTEEDIGYAISKVFTKKETAEMLQTVKKGWYQETLELGEARGEARGDRRRLMANILAVVRKNCRVVQVPDDIVEELNHRQDIVVLESLFEDSLECTSLEQFRQRL